MTAPAPSPGTALAPADERALLAARGPAPGRRLAQRLPGKIRVALMAWLFFWFFLGCPVLALVILPALRLFSRDPRATATRFLNDGLRLVTRAARACGVVDYADPAPPPSVDRGAPYVLVSNHPTFVDMLLLLGSFPELTCVTSGRWSKHWALGPVLRATNYLPGPGSGEAESDDMLGAMVRHLEAGHPLLVFPEGQRSHPDRLRRLRRGAVAAAAAANVPIAALFLGIDRPYLIKEVPLSRPPTPAPVYTFEWLDVVRPEDFDRDPRRIQRHLEERYAARFAERRPKQLSLT